jgi:2-polyprenyl-3-methyl-5-hydroxy-6-metoxy-1,4-benzoquinol methylase
MSPVQQSSSPEARPPSDGNSPAKRPPLAEETAVVREAERQWHDAYYRSHENVAYPQTAEEFRKIFTRIELTPFCEGGWNWWADPRKEAMDAVGDVRGLRVLDYGCGFGKLGMHLALCGAQVWGFDFSREATDIATTVAKRYGLSAQFEQMDAEELTYPENFFDLVIGFGVLHHVVKYPRAGPHLYRVLKPGGKAVFHETLWDNPLINLARRFTSEEAEAGDAHLQERNIRDFCREFRQVTLEKRHLFYMLKRLAKVPQQSLEAPLKPRPFWRLVKSVDNQILRFRPLRRYCGEVIVFLKK